jgi:hypothetical protein
VYFLRASSDDTQDFPFIIPGSAGSYAQLCLDRPGGASNVQLRLWYCGGDERAQSWIKHFVGYVGVPGTGIPAPDFVPMGGRPVNPPFAY